MSMDNLWKLIDLVSEDHLDSLKKLIEVFRDHGELEQTSASCYHHASNEGGLLDHTLRVTEHLLKIREVLAPEISVSDCVLAGVLHDISKAGIPCVGQDGVFKIIPRYVKNHFFDNRKSTSSFNKPFNYGKGQMDFQLATSAVLIAVHFIPNIPVTVLQAIAASDGATVSQSYYHHECKLALLLEYADRWALLEETNRPEYSGVKFGAPIKIKINEGNDKDGIIITNSGRKGI